MNELRNGRGRQEGLVYHELLHQRFGETLHFFLLSIKNYSSPTLARLESDIRNLGISGFCLYELYGPFDVLLRVWLNSGTKRQLDTYLGREEFRNSAPFQVLSQDHWRWAGLLESSRKEAVEIVDTVEPGMLLRAQEGDQEALNSLRRMKIAARVETSSEDKFKFFTMVIPTDIPSRATLGDARTLLINSFASSDLHLSECSIYTGHGFAWAIVKGRVKIEGYYAFRDFVIGLVDHLAVYDFRVFTFMVTRWDTYECDYVSPSSIALARPVDPLITAWIPELDAARIEEELRLQICAFIIQRQYLRRLTSSERDLIHELLVAKLQDSQQRYVQPLATWFIGVEARLRASFEPLVEAVGLSEESVKSFREVIRSQGEESALGSLFRLYSLVLEESGLEAAEDFHSPAFNEASKAVVTLRNDVMHGKFGRVFEKGWLERLTNFADFLPVYSRLTALVDKLASKSDAQSRNPEADDTMENAGGSEDVG